MGKAPLISVFLLLFATGVAVASCEVRQDRRETAVAVAQAEPAPEPYVEMDFFCVRDTKITTQQLGIGKAELTATGHWILHYAESDDSGAVQLVYLQREGEFCWVQTPAEQKQPLPTAPQVHKSYL